MLVHARKHSGSFLLPSAKPKLAFLGQGLHAPDPTGMYRSTLDEFAAVCSSSSYQLSPKPRVFHRRLTDPGQPPPDLQPKSHVMNLQMSGVPAELFLSVKRIVSEFESTYQKMIELVCLRKEHQEKERQTSCMSVDEISHGTRRVPKDRDRPWSRNLCHAAV